ncbi:MAG: DNA polymerase III subunit beta [Armatimonadota bacterium]
MRIICARKDLNEGVQIAGRAVSTRTTLPILGHILFTALDDKMKLTASDLEISMECEVPANIIEKGSFTVQAKLISEILSNLPDVDIEISTDDQNNVNLKCATSDFNLLSLSPDEFPVIPDVQQEVRFEIEPDIIKNAIKNTSFSVSTDESRAILTGILLQVVDSSIKFVSTDTHRLSLQECELGVAEGAVNAIIPARALNELIKIIPDKCEKVEAVISANQIKFTIDNTILISRLIEGQFPNFEKVIPQEHTKKMIVPTEQFMQSVKRANIVARDNSNRITLKSESGTLYVSSTSSNLGSVQEEVEVIMEGEDIKMAFNSKYLLDVLNVIETEAIEIELTGDINPVLIKPQGMDDYLYVLMPMQID